MTRRASAATCFVLILCLPSMSRAQDGVVSFVSSVEFPGKRVTDVTGYVDILTGTEYAIVGHSGANSTGIAVVDLSDPTDPQPVATLDGPPGFDVKVFDTYVYTVTGGGGTGAIIDISNPLAPVRVAGFPSSHNIFIDHLGYMYSSAPGMEIYDLNANPLAPDSLWFDGMGGGHDASVIGDTLYDFHGSSGTFIYDVTDRTNPVEIGHIDPPFVTYHHSGWVTEDRQFLFINDELSQHPAADVTVWDISDISDPTFVSSISDSLATVHNLHIAGDFAFFSYYSAGFKVFDISDPSNPRLVGSYDTDPVSSPGFSGAFGIDAFLPSGYILVSGTSGTDPGMLHIFSVDGYTPVGVADTRASGSILQIVNYPNPFNFGTNITFSGLGESDATVFDQMGREVFRRNLGVKSGRTTFVWNAEGVAPAVYFVRIQSGGTVEVKSLTVFD